MVQTQVDRATEQIITAGDPTVGTLSLMKQTSSLTYISETRGSSSAQSVIYQDATNNDNRIDDFKANVRLEKGFSFVGGPGNSPSITTGTVAPEGVVTAWRGSIYIRSGLDSNCLYVKEVGLTGNTGWVLK